jgi:hypothetical protein
MHEFSHSLTEVRTQIKAETVGAGHNTWMDGRGGAHTALRPVTNGIVKRTVNLTR